MGRPSGGLLVALGALTVSLLVLAPLALMGLRRDAATLQVPAVTVEMSAEGMHFYPESFRVPAGASVRVEFVNNDPSSAHDFQTTGQYRDARIVVWPGERRAAGFISAKTPGKYMFICTVRGHTEAGMVGTLIVE
jgi:plastocyanin